MPAKPSELASVFIAGLLNPAAPVPSGIRGLPHKRYAVYRNNVTVGLVRAMEANFPVVRRLLGEQYFGGLVREFVRQHPPQSPLMFHYGESFGAFLETQADLRNYPYLADVARLEQQMRGSYHEADAPLLDAEKLMLIDADAMMNAVLTAHPAAAIVASRYAIFAIYQASASGDAGMINNPAAAQTVLVARPRHDVTLTALDPAQHAFFEALFNGEKLADAAEAAFALQEQFDLAQALGIVLTSGAFQSIETTKS